MGQGQADLAIQMLKECARNGDWLCLKNLHLVVSWLPVLEKVDSDRYGTNNNISNIHSIQLSSRNIIIYYVLHYYV